MAVEIITNGDWPKDNQIALDEITCKYLQENDCTEDRTNGPGQEITLSSRDGGGGKFINIKTENWSINGDNFEDDILPLLRDFKRRMDETFSTT